jgi:hypothetical protein
LEELLVELGARKYKIGSSSGLNLLNLDRRIHEVTEGRFPNRPRRLGSRRSLA